MAIYVVAYDLNQTGQNYARLIEALRQMPHCKPQKSLWFVDYAGTAAQLRSQLNVHLDGNDTVFVDRVSTGWASYNMQNCAKWLNDRGL
ncbi:hypothetical protein [Falsirhodobacter sp. 20TX0035]|uniref:hypothetical protein n=1 Tax=Falsirhodobacter sp. 20TX0035 TaxID=3022019 RepID=UPI00232FB37E|nr:hypothetical protein [Falsirhodobacter sp. 20TX0035]MDB6454706.1 hypothetical protein [Falsirhodobacter sp. 20TX0035]